jgi:hypothetical protein
MKPPLIATLALLLCGGAVAQERFQKLTEHFYYLQSSSGPNIGALVSNEGILLINPPAESRLPAVVDALKRITPGQVRWIARTDNVAEGWHPAALVRQGASFFASEAAWKLNRKPEHEIGLRLIYSPSVRAEPRLWPSFIFSRQIRLFPGGVEAHLYSPQSARRRSADVVVFMPEEKVLQVGEIFRPGAFPEFGPLEGADAAVGWMDSLTQVIDLVPLLRSAMPQPKPEPAEKEEEEKTLEELVQVVPATGPVSNLQEMKDLLEAARIMRSDIERAVAAGRSREGIPEMPGLARFRSWPGFEGFALRLFDGLSKK